MFRFKKLHLVNMEHKSKTVTVNTILTQTEITINLSWETHETLVSEAKVKIMKIKINTKTTISGIDLHWNYQKHIFIHFWVIYWRTTSTKILTINTCIKQLWSVPNCLIQVPNCPVLSTEMSNSVPTVQVSTEMSRIQIIYPEMIRTEVDGHLGPE